MVTSNIRGHEIFFDGSDWKYADTNELVTELPDEMVPESWKSRCSGDGHKRYIDKNGDRRYFDNDKPIGEMGLRPCAKCGHYPTEDGDDYCLQHLGNVMNACCGHGDIKGYIQFDNGITIRGYFEIEKDKIHSERE